MTLASRFLSPWAAEVASLYAAQVTPESQGVLCRWQGISHAHGTVRTGLRGPRRLPRHNTLVLIMHVLK